MPAMSVSLMSGLIKDASQYTTGGFRSILGSFFDESLSSRSPYPGIPYIRLLSILTRSPDQSSWSWYGDVNISVARQYANRVAVYQGIRY